jgi:hypothetical protein
MTFGVLPEFASALLVLDIFSTLKWSWSGGLLNLHVFFAYVCQASILRLGLRLTHVLIVLLR